MSIKLILILLLCPLTTRKLQIYQAPKPGFFSLYHTASHERLGFLEAILGSPRREPPAPSTGEVSKRLTQVAPWWRTCRPNAGDRGDVGLIPGLGRSPGRGHGNPLQYSCLENPTDRGAWWATVHRVATSQIWWKQLRMHAWIHVGVWCCRSAMWATRDLNGLPRWC